MRRFHPKDIESWLALVQSPCPLPSMPWQAPHFLKPYHLATLALALRRHPGHALALPARLQRYARAMHLGKVPALRRGPGRLAQAGTCSHFPLEHLRHEHAVEAMAQRLSRMFAPVCRNHATIKALDIVLQELMGNCFAHSGVEDEVMGVICAQAWPKGRRAQITLADAGVGIRASLARNLDLGSQLAAGNSCELATGYGVSSSPGHDHSGYGLAVARKLLEQNDGALYLRSGREAFFNVARVQHRFPTRVVYDGCMVVMEWDLDRPMDIQAEYRDFPLPEGVTEDELDL